MSNRNNQFLKSDRRIVTEKLTKLKTVTNLIISHVEGTAHNRKLYPNAKTSERVLRRHRRTLAACDLIISLTSKAESNV